MKLFRFDPEVGKNIHQYDSSGFTLANVAHLPGETVIHCAYLGPNGRIGYHQATIPQLFLVVQGEGWVRSKSSKKTSIKAGQAAYWDQEEWHESGTETGMVVIIMEGNNIDPAKHMSLV